MQFIVSSAALLKNLSLIGGIVSSNNVLPILEDFLFKVKGNKLTITCSDLESMAAVSMEVQVAEGTPENEQMSICIPNKVIVDILKNLPDQPINIVLNERDNTVDLSSNSGKYKIGGESADEFPKPPEAGEATSFEMSSIKLQEAINGTFFATSTDTLRPVMTGVLFEFGGDGITFVATDAHRLVKLNLTDVSCPSEGSIIVPRKPLMQLRNMLPADDSAVSVSFNNSHLFLQHGSMSLSSRLIDGKYPAYNAVIPTQNPFLLTVNRAELLSSLRRVSVFASKGTSQVVFDIVGNVLNISAQDIDFSYEGKETLPCQYEGDDIKIAFNARLLVEMLANLEGDNIKVELSLPSRAGIFRSEDVKEHEDKLMLLMPLLVNI